MSHAPLAQIMEPVATLSRARRRPRGRVVASSALWYVVLAALAVITVFPFFWMLMTSLKGPGDPVYSIPPQFIPGDPSLGAYSRVLEALPIPTFFLNSLIVAVSVGVLNVLVAAMAAYPLAKMRFFGRDAIFYVLLATLIVPAQLTYIPSFVLAVNVFHYYNSLPALILPNLVSAFNIFLLRQAFRVRPQRPARRGPGRRRGGVADLVVDPAADHPAVAGRGGDLHVRHVVERLPVAVADAPHEGRPDLAGRAGRAPELLPVRLPLDRGRRHDHGRADPALLHRRPALLRARPRGRREGVTPGRILERVMLAFEGERVPRWVERRLAEAPAAGLTLFVGYNVRDPAQVRELTAAFQRAGAAGEGAGEAGAPEAGGKSGTLGGKSGALGGPMLVAADQEGGQLIALGEATTPFAGNMALGAVGDEDLTERVGGAIGREARAMGVNVVYAPVLDLANEPGQRQHRDPVVRRRPGGGRPARGGDGPRAPGGRGGRHGQALPGAGRGRPGLAPRARGRGGDARGGARTRARPVPGGDRGRGQAGDVGPRRGARADRRPDAPRHALAGDHGRDAARRARFPRRLDQRRARHARARPGAAQAVEVIAAIRAGDDLLLTTADQAARRRIERTLVAAAARQLFEPADLQASAARLAELRAWLTAAGPAPDLDVVGSAAHVAISRELAERALTRIDRGPDGGEPDPITLAPATRILAIMPEPTDLTPADTSSMVAPGLGRALRTRFASVVDVVVGVSPGDAEIAALRGRARSFDAVVVGTIEAHRQPSQAALVRAIAETGVPTIAVALRTPWDVAVYPEGVPAICTYSILRDSLEALARALAGRDRVPGAPARRRRVARGYRSAMTLHSEILEQPEVARRLLAAQAENIERIAASLRERPVGHVVIAARGTSDHAAVYAQYVLGVRHRLSVGLGTPSIVSLYGAAPDVRDALVIGISQSGASPDIVAVVAAARAQGAPTIAITNEPDSALAAAADRTIDLGAGPELAVAATKTYTAELLAIALLSAALADDPADRAAVAAIPETLARALALEPEIERIAADQAAANRALVIARGYEYATAREWALKLKELARVFADPYSSADFQHGPLALVEPGVPVIAVARAGAPRRIS